MYSKIEKNFFFTLEKIKIYRIQQSRGFANVDSLDDCTFENFFSFSHYEMHFIHPLFDIKYVILLDPTCCNKTK